MGHRQKGPRHGLALPYGLCFFPWPLVSEGACCYNVQVTFIWCGINVFSSIWNDRKRIWIGTHIASLCVCHVRLPTWFLSLTNNVDNQFWLVSSTTPQYPNFYHSIISIFDGRGRSVNIDSTIENSMKIKTSMTSQVGKSSRPYFHCVHNCLVPGKHPQRHWHNSKLNWLTTYLHRHGFRFFWFFFVFIPRTYFYRKQSKYTTPAANPVRSAAGEPIWDPGVFTIIMIFFPLLVVVL